MTEAPTKCTPVGASAASSRRSIVDCWSCHTHLNASGGAPPDPLHRSVSCGASPHEALRCGETLGWDRIGDRDGWARRLGSSLCPPMPRSVPRPLRAATTTLPPTATRPPSPRRSSSGGRSAGTSTARSRRPTRPARWPTPKASPSEGASCSCWTCSRTRRAPACTSATRWASPAPTCTAATSGWPGATCCTRWASTPSGCRPSSSPCRPAPTRPITTAQNVATYREQIRRLGLSHDRRRSIDTTDPEYYRWTQWIFLQIFESWFDPEKVNPAGTLGCARPISELRAELDAGTRELDDGRAWRKLSAKRAGRGDRPATDWHTCPTRRSTGAQGWAPSSPTRRSPPTGAATAATSRCSSAACASG